MTSVNAGLTTAETTESVLGGEAVGIPSLRDAVDGLAAALTQGHGRGPGNHPTGGGTYPHRVGAVRRGSGQG